MAYIGKFRDSSPMICAAGLTKVPLQTVASCLRDYPLDDGIEAVMHEGGLKKNEVEYKRQRMANIRHPGVYGPTRPILYPPVETRYQTLLRDLKETVSSSYWKKEVGKSIDPVGGLPNGMDPLTTTFGLKKTDEVTMKDLINPPKSTYEILYDANEYHPMYRRSHSHYYPAERINRNYLSPPFNPNKKFGTPSYYDKRGIWMKCALRGKNSETYRFASKILSDKNVKTHFQVGQCLTPNNNLECVPEGFRFGIPSERPKIGMEDLLKPDLKLTMLEYDYRCWLNHLNEMRRYLKKRTVNFKGLIDTCKYFDAEEIGIIPFEILYRVMNSERITFNLEFILPLAEIMGFYCDKKVKYHEFLNLFDANSQLPDIGRFYDDNNYCHYYKTTSQAAQLDKNLSDNSKSPVAGLPNRRIDTEKPVTPSDMIRCDLNSLGYESSAGAVVNPSIFTTYGLSHLDFWQPRTAEYLQELFKKIGYNLSKDIFKKLWDVGLELDKTGFVCVDTFLTLVDRTISLEVPPPVEEQHCDETSLLKKKTFQDGTNCH